MITLLYAGRPLHRTEATPEGPDLWISTDELPAATGWELKPEGLCQADRCVRIPHGREHELVRATPAGAVHGPGGRGSRQVNVAALARLLEQPVLREDAHSVREDAHEVWCIAEAAPERRAVAQSLQAPDFTLPDLEGRMHSLADYRGKKIFLVSWASW